MIIKKLNERPVLLVDANREIVFTCKDGIPSLDNFKNINYLFQVNTLKEYTELPVPIAIVDIEEIDFKENKLVVFDLFGASDYVYMNLGIDKEDIKSTASEEFKKVLEETVKLMLSDENYADICCKSYIQNSIYNSCRDYDGTQIYVMKEPGMLKDCLNDSTNNLVSCINKFGGLRESELFRELFNLNEQVDESTLRDLLNTFPNQYNPNVAILKTVADTSALEKMLIGKINMFDYSTGLSFIQGKDYQIPFVDNSLNRHFKFESIISKEYPEETFRNLLDCSKYGIDSEEQYINDIFRLFNKSGFKSALWGLLSEYVDVLSENERFGLERDCYMDEMVTVYNTLNLYMKHYNAIEIFEVLKEFKEILDKKDNTELQSVIDKLVELLENSSDGDSTSKGNNEGKMNLF